MPLVDIPGTHLRIRDDPAVDRIDGRVPVRDGDDSGTVRGLVATPPSAVSPAGAHADGIRGVDQWPVQSTFWRFWGSLPLVVARPLREVTRQLRQRVWEAAPVEWTEVARDTDRADGVRASPEGSAPGI
jgi:hypothetical protein